LSISRPAEIAQSREATSPVGIGASDAVAPVISYVPAELSATPEAKSSGIASAQTTSHTGIRASGASGQDERARAAGVGASGVNLKRGFAEAVAAQGVGPTALLSTSANLKQLPVAVAEASATKSSVTHAVSSTAGEGAPAPNVVAATGEERPAAALVAPIETVRAAQRKPSEETVSAATNTETGNLQVVAHVDAAAIATASVHNLPATPLSGVDAAVVGIPTAAVAIAHQGVASGAPGGESGSIRNALSVANLSRGLETVPAAGAVARAISPQPHQTLLATPTSLEVGVHSGTQGWLKVRAEVGEQGEVTASLTAASRSGEQMLKGQLPALNDYLHSEQMAVTTTVAERVGLGAAALAHGGGVASLASGIGTAGHDGNLLEGGSGQQGQSRDGQSRDGLVQSGFAQSNGQHGDAPQAAPVSADLGRDEVLPAYGGQTGAASSIVSSSTRDGSGQWLNVRV